MYLKILDPTIGLHITVYMDYVALCHLLVKKNAKTRLIRWTLFLQEFDLQIQDKKEDDNLIGDHLSRLQNTPSSKIPVNDHFLNEQLHAILTEPLFADIVNFLVTRETLSHWSIEDKSRLLFQVKCFY